ncbi:hypothetical protein DVH05_013307 [Phytophthora capsici]|nr:hypothetical protein DVH05_013307 [Phytophthora capsici]
MATSNKQPSEQDASSSSDAPPAKHRKTMVRKRKRKNRYGKKTQAWADVAAALAVDVDGRRCRERCSQLLDAYEAKQKASERRSGPCEDYTPKDECLAELLEMREMELLLKTDKKQQKDQQQQEDEQAIAMRDAAMAGMKRGQKKGGESQQRQQLLAYLEQRDGVAHELDKRKIANEEKRLSWY